MILSLFIIIVIIPISKLLGNYNNSNNTCDIGYIIPISKLLGNYNHWQQLYQSNQLYQYLNC